MKSILAILTIFALTAMIPMQKKRIVFFGDSITEAGVKPDGFITRIGEALSARGLAGQFELIGAGVGGNKVYDLYLRMDSDVIARNPDIVVIWIGVNDVWHKVSSGTGTDPDKFEKFYATIIKRLQARNIQLILCTPAVIGEKTDNSNQQDGDLNRYSQIVRNLAAQFHCNLVDLRKAFKEYNLKNNPENKESGILTLDRVHLNPTGNQLVADEMLKVILQNH